MRRILRKVAANQVTNTIKVLLDYQIILYLEKPLRYFCNRCISRTYTNTHIYIYHIYHIYIYIYTYIIYNI